MPGARLVWFLAAALVAAGCAGKAPAPTESHAASAADTAPLRGWVLDQSFAPVEGATVTVHGTNLSTLADATGLYRFEKPPRETPIIVIVEFTGYLTSSKSVTIPDDGSVLLNFTLAPVPVKKPYHDTHDFKGFLSCQGYVVAQGREAQQDCGAVDSNNKPTITFAMGPDTAGVVLELEWQAGTPAASTLNLTVETQNLGDQDRILANAVGPSVLRAQIDEGSSRRFFSQGGYAQVTVTTGYDPDADEAVAGSSVAVQQAFTLHVSIFYVEAPSPTFTAVAS